MREQARAQERNARNCGGGQKICVPVPLSAAAGSGDFADNDEAISAAILAKVAVIYISLCDYLCLSISTLLPFPLSLFLSVSLCLSVSSSLLPYRKSTKFLPGVF